MHRSDLSTRIEMRVLNKSVRQTSEVFSRAAIDYNMVWNRTESITLSARTKPPRSFFHNLIEIGFGSKACG